MAGGGHVPENDFFGYDKGKFLCKGIVGHLRIKICKNSRTLIVGRMFGIIDVKVFDGYPFGHITGVAKIMLSRIGSADYAGSDWFASGWHKSAVADDKLSLPRTAIVRTQIDKASSINFGILHGKSPAADSVYSLVTQR